MVKVCHIKQVISHNIEIEERFTLAVGNTGSYACVEQRITRGCRLGIIREIGPVAGLLIKIVWCDGGSSSL
jgi:hypothetical protein